MRSAAAQWLRPPAQLESPFDAHTGPHPPCELIQQPWWELRRHSATQPWRLAGQLQQRRQSHEFDWTIADIAEVLADWQAEWRQRHQQPNRAAADQDGEEGAASLCCTAPVTCSVLLREAIKVHAGFLGRVGALLPLLLLLVLTDAPANLTVGRVLFLQVKAHCLVQLASLATQQLLLLLSQASRTAVCSAATTTTTHWRAAADNTFGLCRTLLPVGLWCLFFARCSSSSSSSAIRGCLLLAYVAGKALQLQPWLLQLRASLAAAAPSCCRHAHSASCAATQHPGRQDAGAASCCCPICYEDGVAEPLVLSQCGHVFCRPCAVEWVAARQQATCPMCRSPVAPPQLHALQQEKAAARAALGCSCSGGGGGGGSSGTCASAEVAAAGWATSAAHVSTSLQLPQLW